MLGVGVDMADDVDDAVGVSPFHKIDAHADFFAATAEEGHAEIPGLTVRPEQFVSIRRASTESCLYFSMQALQSRRIKPKLGHADN